MKFSILVAFLFVLAVANAYPSNSVSSSEPQRKTRSWFGSLKKIVTKFARKIYYWKDKCHGLECPDYELKKKTDNYELRCYSNYSWVGTQYVGKFALPQRSAWIDIQNSSCVEPHMHSIQILLLCTRILLQYLRCHRQIGIYRFHKYTNILRRNTTPVLSIGFLPFQEKFVTSPTNFHLKVSVFCQSPSPYEKYICVSHVNHMWLFQFHMWTTCELKHM